MHMHVHGHVHVHVHVACACHVHVHVHVHVACMLCVVVRGGGARLAALKQLLCRGRLDEAHHLFAPRQLARLLKAGRRARGGVRGARRRARARARGRGRERGRENDNEAEGWPLVLRCSRLRLQ